MSKEETIIYLEKVLLQAESKKRKAIDNLNLQLSMKYSLKVIYHLYELRSFKKGLNIQREDIKSFIIEFSEDWIDAIDNYQTNVRDGNLSIA